MLGRLSVSRKLLLIYLLDLTAVIFISGILIKEKFIAIDFARKEVQGNAYVQAVRDPLVDAALAATGDAPERSRLKGHAEAVLAAERLKGDGLDTAELATQLATALQSAGVVPDPELAQRMDKVLARGRDLLTRVGNQSNLILDPDLDSYYTMSLLVLRYPELLEQVHGLGRLLQAGAVARDAGGQRTQFLIFEGRLDATARGIQSDHAEAYAAGGPALRQALQPRQQALELALEAYRRAARQVADEGATKATLGQARDTQRALMQALQYSWHASNVQMDRLLQARIDGLVQRMWLHLGTALVLLGAILALVTLVARSISRPLRHLSGVADTVRRTGDHSLRAQWHSSDEIGRLVDAFNEMLGQLDREREAQKELAASARAAEAQRSLVESTPIALVVTSIPGHDVLHANPPADAWLGGRRQDPWKAGLEPGVRARFFQQLSDRGAVNEFEVRWLAGAEPAWAVLSARRLSYQGQDALLTAFAPINHLKLMERRLELWAKVFEASSEGILIVDAERRILSANQAFSRHSGHELQDVVGEKPELLLAGSNSTLPEALWHTVMLRGTWQGELNLRRRNGSEYPAWVMVNAVRHASGWVQGGASAHGGRGGSEVSHYIFTSIDISDRKRSEQRIRFLAEHDVLTELPNRSLCTERLRLAVQQAQRQGRKVAVMFIDLDRFKDINDSLGHHIGDGLLRSVAGRLLDAVRAGDTVSRLGGDEFVVVLSDLENVDEAAHIVHERLIPRVREPHRVEGAELHVSCSVGIAIFPDDATDIDLLMRDADIAMYQAKAGGKDKAQFFSAEMTERAEQRLHMEAQLRHAQALNQLQLHWQPRVCAHSGRMLGVEGLLRWQHPELGAVSPAVFIPLAEESGLIVQLGAWVIEQACAQIAAWREAGLPPFFVSINLSARQLRDEQLINTVRQSLVRHAVPEGQLELELTESMVMDKASSNLLQLHALRELGVGLAIDDFGTGYSSLAYLNRFPITKLKIDRSFVHQMLDDPSDRAITLAIIGLGHTLGLKVVAEGVERPQEAALLREANCDELQGYLFGKPMLAEALPRWMADQPAGSPA
ncbi:diguanylate phosphodiesterase [beta proteobacterium AAP121]|nr:diguanylate phosphodiesterase [beta proteobacterium AAP65]KPF98749.1 diguanylate phosphodiesterase [beta proteobacterium AAP121]